MLEVFCTETEIGVKQDRKKGKYYWKSVTSNSKTCNIPILIIVYSDSILINLYMQQGSRSFCPNVNILY